MKTTTLLLMSICFSLYATAQINPRVELDGITEIRGTLYQSTLFDNSSININNRFTEPSIFNSTFDSLHHLNTVIGRKIDNTKFYNTIIGASVGIQHEGNHSTLIGTFAGDFQEGDNNISIGTAAGVLTSGDNNTYIGYITGTQILGYENVIIGNRDYDISDNDIVIPDRQMSKNVILGYNAGNEMPKGDGNIIIGPNAGPQDSSDNKLYIGSINSSGTPLIGGDIEKEKIEMNGSLILNEELIAKNSILVHGRINNPDDLVRIGGDLYVSQSLEVEQELIIGGNTTVASNLTVKDSLFVEGIIQNATGPIEISDDVLLSTLDGQSTNIRLMEGAGFGFKLNYNGNKDRLELSSEGFAGNTEIRTTWMKNGKVGFGTSGPLTTLHIGTGTDAGTSSGGYLTIGSASDHITIDNNEMMARSNFSNPAPMYINLNGEAVVVGTRIQLAYNSNDNVIDKEGQIRYNKSTDDFEGFDGSTWYSLTGNKSDTASLQGGISSNKSIQYHYNNTIVKLENAVTSLEREIKDIQQSLKHYKSILNTSILTDN